MERKNYFIKVGGSFTEKLLTSSAEQVAVGVSYMTLSEHLSFVSEILNKLEINLEGEGMEIGAGASVLSNSLVRIFPNIKKYMH